MVFRSITVGLLGALVYLVASMPRVATHAPRHAAIPHHHAPRAHRAAMRPAWASSPSRRPPRIVRPRPPRRIAPRPAVRIPDVTVIDVAPGLDGVAVAGLVTLRPGERIATVDDRPARSDATAGALIAARVDDATGRTRRYIDLGVRGPAGLRRVLVMLH